MVLLLAGFLAGVLLSVTFVAITLQMWPEKWDYVVKVNLGEKATWKYIRSLRRELDAD